MNDTPRTKKISINTDGRLITLDYLDYEDQAFDLSALSEEMREQLMIHGAKQKLGDKASGIPSPSECRQKIQEVWESLLANNWTTRVTGESLPRITLLAEAIAQVQGLPLADAREKIELLDEDTRKAVRSHPQIKAAMAQIKAARAQAKLEEAGAAEGPSLDELI